MGISTECVPLIRLVRTSSICPVEPLPRLRPCCLDIMLSSIHAPYGTARALCMKQKMYLICMIFLFLRLIDGFDLVRVLST